MNEYTADLLTKLADKLGTTVEHLWGVLIVQAPISSTVTCCLLVLFIVTGIALVKHIFRMVKSSGDQSFYVLLIIPGAALLISILTLCVDGAKIIAGFVNPEYWALMKVLESL